MGEVLDLADLGLPRRGTTGVLRGYSRISFKEREYLIENWFRQCEGDPDFEFDLLAIDIGERIVERMKHLGLTRTKLAGKIGVSKSRISQILSGHDNLTLKSLVAVASALDSRIELRLRIK